MALLGEVTHFVNLDVDLSLLLVGLFGEFVHFDDEVVDLPDEVRHEDGEDAEEEDEEAGDEGDESIHVREGMWSAGVLEVKKLLTRGRGGAD